MSEGNLSVGTANFEVAMPFRAITVDDQVSRHRPHSCPMAPSFRGQRRRAAAEVAAAKLNAAFSRVVQLEEENARLEAVVAHLNVEVANKLETKYHWDPDEAQCDTLHADGAAGPAVASA